MSRPHPQPSQIVIGLLFCAIFLAFGGWILQWCGQQALRSVDSVGWPTVPALVLSSGVDRQGEAKPVVRYRYASGGQSLESTRLGFDIFDKPGGRGSASSRAERYAVGAQVPAFIDPEDPHFSVLEPGDLSPFVMPAFFGLLISGLGLVLTARTVGYARGRPPPQWDAATRARGVGWGTAVLLGLCLLLVNADSAVQEVQAKAMNGARPMGLSPTAFFLLLQAMLLLPLPWCMVAVAQLMARSNDRGQPIHGISSLLRALWVELGQPGPGQRAARVVLACLAAFVLTIGAWIAFAAWRGI